MRFLGCPQKRVLVFSNFGGIKITNCVQVGVGTLPPKKIEDNSYPQNDQVMGALVPQQLDPYPCFQWILFGKTYRKYMELPEISVDDFSPNSAGGLFLSNFTILRFGKAAITQMAMAADVGGASGASAGGASSKCRSGRYGSVGRPSEAHCGHFGSLTMNHPIQF